MEKWMDLGILNKNWSRNEIWLKTACPDMSTFFKRKTDLSIWNQFGTDLTIPNIWVFGRLNQK